MTSKEKEGWEIEVEANPEIIRVPEPVKEPMKQPEPV